MPLTNNLSLPDPIVRAVTGFETSYDGTKRADISVTGLLQPPQMYELRRRHREVITEDIADRIYALLGQVVHELLHRAGAIDKHVMTEERLYTDLLGWTVSGQMDRCLMIQSPEGWSIQDWKVGSVWEAIDGVKPEREKQLNLYAELLRRNGKSPVVSLSNVFIFRDWSKSRAKNEPTYPQTQVMVIPVRVWTPQDATALLSELVIRHQHAREAPDDLLPPCSDEERWLDPPEWAVMKEGNKKATKLFPEKKLAEVFIDQQVYENGKLNGKLTIVERPSEPTRCISYCSANKVCKQFQGSPYASH